MGESVGVSVSFGKYENDALSWEKWSTFSPNNKYLEEVGKCSTPGSVAQKKAFFEAHYKKIAAMKAAAAAAAAEEEDCIQILNQQPQIDGSGEEDESMDLLANSNAEKLEEAVLVNDESVKLHFNVSESESQHLLMLPSQSPITLDTNFDKLEQAVLVNNESMKLVKLHFQVDLETPTEIRQPKAQKLINPNKVEKNSIGLKKKPASLVSSKSPETPASRLSKEILTSSSKKASAPSSSSTTKNKKQSVSESRRFTPVSLHLSMSMNSVNSDTASSVTVTSSRRRSLFMEQMGDKDIVKRAFKTFQNRVNQLPSYDNRPKQIPTKRPEQKTSTSVAYQKENERSRKAVEKINPARGQLGPTWKSVSSGSLKKEVGVNERRIKAGLTSVDLKSNERAERRKEFFKNLKEKSNAREAERISKSKEVKDAEMKKVKQNLLKLNAKRVPQAQGPLRSTSDKLCSDKEARDMTRLFVIHEAGNQG